MSSYWDYLQDSLKDPFTNPIASPIWALYNKAYDESHGGNRYALSKVPILGYYKKFRDAMQQAEDTYNNTGKDPAYSTRFNGPGFESVYGGALAGGGAVGMARSLSTVYTPEVIEDVSKTFNGMYR